MDQAQMAANMNVNTSAISEAALEAADVHSTLKDWEPGGGSVLMQSAIRRACLKRQQLRSPGAIA